MDASELLKIRASTPWRELGEPGPGDGQIAEFLEAAMATPDHGAVRPWRFVVVRGAARQALGALFTEALLKRNPDADETTIEKDLDRMRRVPLLIVVAARIDRAHKKVPPAEQIACTGMAAQAILLAAQARGYGGIMLTGDHAYDPHVKAGLGLDATDEIVAFVYIGTAQRELKPRKRPDSSEFTTEWKGPA